MKKLN